MKIAGGIVLGLVAVVALTVLLFDINWIRGWLAHQAGAAVGREVALGEMAVDWSWTPRVTVDGLEVANAEWGSRPEMITVERLEFTVALRELLRGRLVLPELIVSRPDVLLETTQEGTGNWRLPGATDTEAATVPTVGNLKVEEATLAYVDDAHDLQLDATLASLVGHSDDRQLVLSGDGMLQGTALQLKMVTGTLPALQNGREPYPVDLDLSLGDTRIAISGTIARPLDALAVDLSVAIEGPDLAELALTDALPLPTTPPYALSGSLVRDGPAWRLEDFDGRLGKSDLHGSIALDFGREPPAVDADLVADMLDVAELKDVFGIPPIAEVVEAAAADDGLIAPDDKLDLAPLRAVDGRVGLRVKRLLAPGLPLDDLVADLTLDGALLRAQPVEFGIGGGELRTFVSLYGDKDPPGIDVLTYVRGVPLKALFRNTPFVEETGGEVDGWIKLSGRGNAPHDLLSTADGGINLVMQGGQMSGLLVELIGLDVAEALALYVGEDTPVPIRCLVADLAIEAGVVRPGMLLLDTTDTLITGAGQLDLGTETIDLTLTPEPKDVSVLSLRSKVSIEGRLADLSIAPDVASLLRLLPPIDLGTAEDAPCEQLIERARREFD